MKTFVDLLKVIGYWPYIFHGKKKYIFIVSHMRSRSSLLSHILGSHQDISGYAEMAQHYHSTKDFMNLRYKVWSSNNQILKGHFVLDKILHNKYKISESFLASTSVHICYLLRRPEDTLKSIIQLANTNQDVRKWQGLDQAAAYYENRICQMTQYTQKVTNKSFFVESNDLIDNTEPLLCAISNWLSLSQPLSSSYSLFKRTGEAGYGDPSKVISTGQVVHRKNRYENTHIPATILKRVNKSYMNTLTELQTKCTHLGTPAD